MKHAIGKYTLVLLGLIAVGSAGCNGGGCNPMGSSTIDAGKIMLNASWESGDTSSWTQLNGSSSLSLSSTAEAGTGAGLFTFSPSGGAAEAYVAMTPSASSGNYLELSFMLRPLDSASPTVTEFHLFENGVDRAGLRWNSSLSQLEAYSNNSWHNLPGGLTIDAWNFIEVEYSLQNHYYGVWINDAHQATALRAGETLNARSGWDFSISNASSPGYSLLMDNIFAYVTN